MLIAINGELVPLEQAKIPVTDDGFLRGDGIFEVTRVYQGKPFALEDHLRRLGHSGDVLWLPVDLDLIRDDIAKVLSASAGADGLLRIVLTRGGIRIVMLEPLPKIPTSLRVTPLVFSPQTLLDGAKTLSYAANMLAVRIAKDAGYDEPILVKSDGTVLEGPTWSLFWVKDGEVFVPPLEAADARILASITRAKILEVFGGNECSCKLSELEEADELFFASSVREVIPIVELDGRKYPNGEITARVAQALSEHIQKTLELR